MASIIELPERRIHTWEKLGLDLRGAFQRVCSQNGRCNTRGVKGKTKQYLFKQHHL